MNEQLIKIGLESGMLNYVDNETPRHYFLSGHADEQDLAKFAELIVKECADIATINQFQWDSSGGYVLKHFGIEIHSDKDYEIGTIEECEKFAESRRKLFGVE